MENKFFIIIICLLFTYCKPKKEHSISLKENNTVYIHNSWKKDEQGLLNLRNKKLVDELFLEYNLVNPKKEEFIKVFGEPNLIDSINKQEEVLIYYFNNIMNIEKCYANFYFKNDILISKEFICE